MLRDKIFEFAAEKGCIAGICDALPLGEGRRLNPALHFRGAQSIIVLGKPYKTSPFFNLSSLAFGRDYHHELGGILEEMKRLTGGGLAMVDNGALEEKPFAVKAGLGFLGKNGLVISREFGSFFNIGLLVVDVALEASHEAEGACPEGCRLCAEACPGEVCVSLLTQKKGDLAGEDLGGQLYGCDLCQICCPFNNIAPPSKEMPPEEILAMDEAAFAERFGHTAMAWRGLAHLQRNAKLLLGKSSSGMH